MIRMTLSLISLLATAAVAGTVTKTQLQIQSDVQHELTPAVRSWDPGAIVVADVRLSQDTVAQPLPGTPFVARGVEIIDNPDEIRVSEIAVAVYSTRSSLPPSVMEVIKAMVASYGVQPRVTLKPIAPSAPAPVEPRSQLGLPEIATYGFGLVSVMLLALLMVLYWFGSVIRGFFPGVTTALQAIASRETDAPAPMKASREVQGVPASNVASGSQSATGRYDALSVDAAAAMLCDCYWSGQDEYAAHLLRHLGPDHKAHALRNHPWLDPYLRRASTLASQDMMCEHDLAYLNPLPIHDIGPADLTRLVRQHPEIYDRLPSLRLHSLQLSAAETIRLLSQPRREAEVSEISAWVQGTRSIRRSFAQSYSHVRFADVHEEAELLEKGELTAEQLAALPTLGLAERLPDAELAKVLRSFSSRELATAWIAPERILARFASALPEKKLGNIRSFLESSRPSRESPAFVALRERFEECYRRQSEETKSREAA